MANEITLTALTAWLQERLNRELPGLEAQLKMSSIRRIRELMSMQVPLEVKKSGVLILFYPHGTEVRIVLMRRPDYDGVHGGQISLPGGKWEPGDASITDTALREAHEEIGIRQSEIRVLGNLTQLYIPPSNFHVTPVVGFQTVEPIFHPDPAEVADLIEIELGELLNEQHVRMEKIRLRNGMELDAPGFNIRNHIIWGATAMILNELKEVLKEFVPEKRSMD